MAQTSIYEPQDLLEELGWVRALARQLTEDVHSAEDLVQDTFLVALSGAPARPVPLRRWLAGVLRNLLRSGRRSQRHRADREVARAREATTPSTSELVERASIQKNLVGELLELEEPYRTTLLLRFFDGLSHAEIAKRTSVPPSTVGTRIARGLARMRERLRQQHESEDAWVSALLPLAQWRPKGQSVHHWSTPALASVPAKLLSFAGATLVVLAALYWTHLPRPVTGLGEPYSATSSTPALLPAAQQVLAFPGSARDSVATTNDAARSASPLTPARRATYHGRVIDLDGSPVPGVPVLVGPLHSDADDGTDITAQPVIATATCSEGRFELPGETRGRVVSVRCPAFSTVLASYTGQVERELLIVVGHKRSLAGRVLDSAGSPIAGAELAIVGRIQAVSHLGMIIDRGLDIDWEANTDRAGSFAFEDAAAIPGGVLSVRAPGYRSRFLPLPALDDEALVVVLELLSPDVSLIEGRVFEPGGKPAKDALVSIGAIAVQTGESGHFVLEPAHPSHARIAPETPLVLRAVKRGFAPADRLLPSLTEARETGWGPPVALTLGPLDEAPSVTGCVVDTSGAPAAGIDVFLLDSTPFGQVPGDGSGQLYLQSSVEELSAGAPTRARTDDRGRFSLSGLLPRPYTIEAIAPGTLRSSGPVRLRPGEHDALLRLNPPAQRLISGSIVDTQGNAIEDVHLQQVRTMTGGGLIFGPATQTDSAGAFELVVADATSIVLCLKGERIVPEMRREIGAGGTGLRLVVGRRCHVQFLWEGHAAGSEVRIFDAAHEPLELVVIRSDNTRVLSAVTVQDKMSEVFAVSQRARFAVVYQGEHEIARATLHLEPGELERTKL